MEERICILSWIGNFILGEYDSEDVKTQIKAGWYDWFCKDSALARKTKRMGNIIKNIREGGKDEIIDEVKEKLNNTIERENRKLRDELMTHPWFKNNCPLNGPLYDDFRFAELETGDVMFTIQLDCCWNEKKYTVFGRTPDGKFHSDKPLFETDSVRELLEWLNQPWDSWED